MSERSLDECVLEYEQALRGTHSDDLVRATLRLLDGVTASCNKGGLVERQVPVVAREHWYTRAAAALTRYITDPATRISFSGFEAIAKRKQRVAYIFNASGFRNMKHLVALMKDITADGTETINTSRAAVLLVFLGLDDTPDFLMDTALRQPPNLLLHIYLGWLNQRAVLTTQGEKNRGRLLTSGHLLSDAQITDNDIEHVVNAWMYSSYASEPKKHDIKRWFNKLLLKRLSEAGIKPAPVHYSASARPKMMVIHERFGQKTAMFRCYAPMIRTLSEYFDTVALADTAMIDDAADDLFDEVIRLERTRPNLAQIVELIQAQKADVIWYPSLGMGHWTVMVAGLRLAPVQIMTHGHPATSMMETIDYAYVSEMEGDLASIHSEKIVRGLPTAAFDAHSDLPLELPDLVLPSDREVRIAVNSKVMKLSWRLLEVCKRIEKEASVPVRFSFFPGELHANMDGLHAAIQAQLPSAAIVPYVAYDKFLQEMCKCDLALAAFPFGNTNSTVDTCLLGLPTVVHFGPESPAQTDWLVLRTAGLPSWLVCDNDEDYFQTALRLVNDPAARTEAMAGLDRMTLRQRLIENIERTKDEPFGHIAYQLHKHHEALQNTSQRVFDYADILKL
jgi:hypothetical protein